MNELEEIGKVITTSTKQETTLELICSELGREELVVLEGYCMQSIKVQSDKIHIGIEL